MIKTREAFSKITVLAVDIIAVVANLVLFPFLWIKERRDYVFYGSLEECVQKATETFAVNGWRWGGESQPPTCEEIRTTLRELESNYLETRWQGYYGVSTGRLCCFYGYFGHEKGEKGYATQTRRRSEASFAKHP